MKKYGANFTKYKGHDSSIKSEGSSLSADKNVTVSENYVLNENRNIM